MATIEELREKMNLSPDPVYKLHTLIYKSSIYRMIDEKVLEAEIDKILEMNPAAINGRCAVSFCDLVDECMGEDITPLQLAIRSSSYKLAKYLLTKPGINLTKTNKYYIKNPRCYLEAPIHNVIHNFLYLSFDENNDEEEEFEHMMQGFKENRELLRALLKHGADPNQRTLYYDYSKKGETPIQMAAEINETESMRILFEFGADASELKETMKMNAETRALVTELRSISQARKASNVAKRNKLLTVPPTAAPMGRKAVLNYLMAGATPTNGVHVSFPAIYRRNLTRHIRKTFETNPINMEARALATHGLPSRSKPNNKTVRGTKPAGGAGFSRRSRKN